MFDALLRSHLTRYPEMQIQDVYKLVHQAAMGSEHAGTDPLVVGEKLARELAEMGAGPDEPAMDPISADGEIVRIHLRPYLASGGSVKMLLGSFLSTASDFRGEIRVLESNWDKAVLAHLFPSTAMDEFIQAMKACNYPAVHHSKAFVQAYKPAYRVIWRKCFPDHEIGD